MRSRPNPSFGQGLSDWTKSLCEGIELPPVARELVTFSLDHILRRVLDEACVAEHALRAVDLSLQARDLSRGVAVACALGRFHDGLEDPELFALERYAHTAAAEHLSCLLHTGQRLHVDCVGLVGLEPRRDDQTRLAVRQ